MREIEKKDNSEHSIKSLISENDLSLLKDYPPFNPSYLARLSRGRHENCMSYALNHRLSGPGLLDISNKKYVNKSKALNYVATELNEHYKDDELVLIAEHEDGELPKIKEDYYVVALTISYKTGYNFNKTLYQKEDYHFLVQNNDGYFSHRRGQAKAEKTDAKGNLIISPEKADLYYIIPNILNNKIQDCFDYKFIGYFYIKTNKNRLENMQEQYELNDSNHLFTAKEKRQSLVSEPQWKIIGEFKAAPYDYSIHSKREVLLKNVSAQKQITRIEFIGFQNNKLKVTTAFTDIDVCNEFLDQCPSETISSLPLLFEEEKIIFTPSIHKELDVFLKLLHEFDPLDKSSIQNLPLLLNTKIPKRKTYEEWLESYPYFNEDFITGEGNFCTRNCLSYALNMNKPLFSLSRFSEKQGLSKDLMLHYVAKNLNSELEDDNLVLVASHEPGELPSMKNGYYLIALALSYPKEYIKVNNEKLYQSYDYHFLAQNNNGYFSHRRGQGFNPECNDSDGNLITIPEKANFFYISQEEQVFGENEEDEKVPVCFDYQFIGYFYVKTKEKRFVNYPEESYRMLNEIELTIKEQPKLKEIFSNFSKKFFLSTPLPEFFVDTHQEIAEIYKVIVKENNSLNSNEMQLKEYEKNEEEFSNSFNKFFTPDNQIEKLFFRNKELIITEAMENEKTMGKQKSITLHSKRKFFQLKTDDNQSVSNNENTLNNTTNYDFN